MGMFALPCVRIDQVDTGCLLSDAHGYSIPFGFTEVIANPLYYQILGFAYAV